MACSLVSFNYPFPPKQHAMKEVFSSHRVMMASQQCIEDSSAIPVVPARDSRPHWAAGEEQGGSLWGVTQPVTAAVVGRGPGVRAAMAPYS